MNIPYLCVYFKLIKVLKELPFSHLKCQKSKTKSLGGSNAAHIAAPSAHNSRHGLASQMLTPFIKF